jgi:hypothetical protein
LVKLQNWFDNLFLVNNYFHKVAAALVLQYIFETLLLIASLLF